MSGLVDKRDDWCGGDAVLVQMGDIFDRGDHDLEAEQWLHALGEQAQSAGGAVHCVLGNHEVLNCLGDHSMATRGAFDPFEGVRPEIDERMGGDWEERLGKYPAWARPRLAAMLPGGPVARLMAKHAACIKVGDSLFVHAGLLPKHLAGAGAAAGGDANAIAGDAVGEMRAINFRVWSWLMGQAGLPQDLSKSDSLIWTRAYSSPDGREIRPEAREDLERVLWATGTARMVVGHTPQRMGINSAADGRVWRVDTGMTAMIGGRPEVLEIMGDSISVLTEYKPIPASERACSAARPPLRLEVEEAQ